MPREIHISQYLNPDGSTTADIHIPDVHLPERKTLLEALEGLLHGYATAEPEALEAPKLSTPHEDAPRPFIQIQTGCGVILPFRADGSFGVVPLDFELITARSDLLNEGKGHSHAVCTDYGRRAILSGTETECHDWLAEIASLLTQAGEPTLLTKRVTYAAELPETAPKSDSPVNVVVNFEGAYGFDDFNERIAAAVRRAVE